MRDSSGRERSGTNEIEAPTREKGSMYSGGEKGKTPMGKKPSVREKSGRYPGGEGSQIPAG